MVPRLLRLASFLLSGLVFFVACSGTTARSPVHAAVLAARPGSQGYGDPACAPLPRADRMWLGFGKGMALGHSGEALAQVVPLQRAFGLVACDALATGMRVPERLMRLEFLDAQVGHALAHVQVSALPGRPAELVPLRALRHGDRWLVNIEDSRRLF